MSKEIILIIASAIIGGLVTLIVDRVRDKSKKKHEKQNKKHEIWKNRPEFKIIKMRNYLDKPGYRIDSNTCDKELFLASIDSVCFKDNYPVIKFKENIKDRESWVCVEYVLQNVGKTTVYEIDIISNFMKDTCIFQKDIIDEYFSTRSYLNYNVLLDRRIDPNEEFSLKLCYHKDSVLTGLFSAITEIGMKDEYGRLWFQPFFSPENKIYESRMITSKEFKRRISTELALKCFKKPYLW